MAQSPPSNVRVCAPVNAWRWHSHNLHLEPGVCAYVNIWRWCIHLQLYVCSCPCLEVAQRYSNNLHLQLCMCAHVHAWRWHSDTATISILNCVCVLMSMLISTLKRVLMSMLGGGIATMFILTRECVRMSMIGGGIATISILNRECVCLCHAWSGIATISTLKLVCVCVCVCSCQCLVGRNERTFLAIKERHTSIIIKCLLKAHKKYFQMKSTK